MEQKHWLEEIYEKYGVYQNQMSIETGIPRSTLSRIVSRNTPKGRVAYEVVMKINAYVRKLERTKEK